MRALFHHPAAGWTGGARAFAAAAHGLAARGWQVTYACCPGGEAERRARALGLDVVALADEQGVLGASGGLARALRAHFVEVVFVHGERDQLVAAGAVWRAGRAAVVRRVPPGAEPTLGRATRTALRTAATGLLCSWPEQARAVPAGLTALGTVVADVGVAVAPEPAGDGAAPVASGAAATPGTATAPLRRRIVCVHDAGAALRTATLLRAAAMLAPRHPELRVQVVGPGSDDEGLRMHAAALGINRIVAHLGERDDTARLLAGADLAWVTADGDDGAFGALDGMAARVPVLVERGSVPAHYVPDGIAGVHLVPGDVPGTAAIIAQLLAAADDRRAMGGAGAARVARAYTEGAMVDGFARAAAAARDRTRWRA